ncbi:calphotin-like [Diorhabda carinulata]|uniref:calphotin-like n=1 Tax=Diorhabda carinulata TaxID=1163345 RepID=UPI0025A03DED|nr:calphotin-like [Diorhabda carinulata]
MNGSVITFFTILAVASTSPSGLGLGLGWGVVAPRAVVVPPSSATVISKPIELPHAYNVVSGPIIASAPAIAPVAPWAIAPVAPWGIAPAVIPAPIAAPVAPAGAVAVTNGGGVVEVSGHGAVVSGPKTAPVVIEGPSGTVKAKGLWGPTLAGVLH